MNTQDKNLYIRYSNPIISVVIITFFCLSFLLNQVLAAENSDSIIHRSYAGSLCKGNYVWGGAMNLAWNELNENVLKEKLVLATDDKIAIEMLSKLNHPSFGKNDLDEPSYYNKSGTGTKNPSNRICN